MGPKNLSALQNSKVSAFGSILNGASSGRYWEVSVKREVPLYM